jgi:hypothetical protein
VKLRRGLSLLWLFAEQFAVRSIDEMKPATGLADHGFVAALGIVRCDLIRQPVLHVHSGPGTFEDDVAHMTGELLRLGGLFALDPNQCGRAQADAAARASRSAARVLSQRPLMYYFEGFSRR